MAKVFHFAIESSFSLSVDQLWPDGNAPRDPTVEDVVALIRQAGGPSAFIKERNLLRGRTLTVADDRNSEVVS